MKWTTQKPTQPGFYWTAQSPRSGWIVYVYEGNSGLRVEDGDMTCPLSDYSKVGYWAGPIQEPKEQS